MICAVVLAAGCSSRMGSQKLLLPFGSKTVIAHIVDQILAASIDRVYVVVGHRKKQIESELSGRPVLIVNNPDYESGMLSSVRCGLRAVDKKCQAILVALGDQPSVTTALVDQMVQSFATTEKQILVPLYQGRRGHPILFSMIFRDEILADYDEVGLRGLLQAHSDDIFEMNVSSPAVLSDMDFPADYQRELTLLEERDRDKSQ
jgi:molybdenum cofactor cytidylyltransferase